jgi:hypothetical protein
MSGSRDSLQKAELRPGDFGLRRNNRQMFGNYVVLSQAGGTPGPLLNFRRSANFVATPVYDVPKLWWLEVEFETVLSSPVAAMSPWVPAALGGAVVRVTVTYAIDRDKKTVEQTYDLAALTSGANLRNALPEHLFVGHQVTVTVEILQNNLSSAPVGVQVSLVEVTNDERDGYRDTTITRFAQSASSQNFLLPNKRRRQFFVQNMGTTPLYVAFSFFAVGPGATAFFTYALPNKFDVYESPRDCWQGYVSGVWDADGGAAIDQALVTEGT